MTENIIKKKKGFYKKRGIWYYCFKNLDGKWIYKSSGSKEYEEALEDYLKNVEPFINEVKSQKKRINNKLYSYSHQLILSEKWEEYLESIKNDRSSWLYKTYYHIKGRKSHLAKRGRTIEVTLSYEDLIKIAISSNGRCQVTGIPFSDYKPSGAKTCPYKPSLDRIDSKKGYTIENCRLVVYCINLAMSEWGDEVLEKIGLSFIYKKLVTDYEDKLIFNSPVAYEFEK